MNGAFTATSRVNVNAVLSQTADALSDVYQGPVIGLVAFVVYVNDLPDHLAADSLLYADDVKVSNDP